MAPPTKRPRQHKRLRRDLPDDDSLEAALAATLDGTAGGELVLLERVTHDYSSSFPAEIVRCRLGDEELLLLCKYGIEQRRTAHGHRGGVAYEALVYREVLEPLSLTVPRLFGTLAPDGRATWLFLEYLGEGGRAGESASPEQDLRLAAGWVAAFHAATERRLARGDMPTLTVYDREYYVAWARRTEEFARASNRRLPWLPALCDAFEDFAEELLAPPLAVIHGEFTPHNILIRDGAAYPIDWESAAVASWTLDLVSLTQKWPRRTVRACKEEYVRARWPDGDPEGIDRLLDVARLYWDFRWLGDRPEWLEQRRLRSRFPSLRAAGKRLGAI